MPSPYIVNKLFKTILSAYVRRLRRADIISTSYITLVKETKRVWDMAQEPMEKRKPRRV